MTRLLRTILVAVAAAGSTTTGSTASHAPDAAATAAAAASSSSPLRVDWRTPQPLSPLAAEIAAHQDAHCDRPALGILHNRGLGSDLHKWSQQLCLAMRVTNQTLIAPLWTPYNSARGSTGGRMIGGSGGHWLWRDAKFCADQGPQQGQAQGRAKSNGGEAQAGGAARPEPDESALQCYFGPVSSCPVVPRGGKARGQLIAAQIPFDRYHPSCKILDYSGKHNKRNIDLANHKVTNDTPRFRAAVTEFLFRHLNPRIVTMAEDAARWVGASGCEWVRVSASGPLFHHPPHLTPYPYNP